MTYQTQVLSMGGTAEKRRVLQVRRLFRDLADRMPDRERARRIEADLNDAWLCLQLARVSEDHALALARHRAYRSLLSEALRAAGQDDLQSASLA